MLDEDNACSMPEDCHEKGLWACCDMILLFLSFAFLSFLFFLSLIILTTARFDEINCIFETTNLRIHILIQVHVASHVYRCRLIDMTAADLTAQQKRLPNSGPTSMLRSPDLTSCLSLAPKCPYIQHGSYSKYH
jgi:hypothetical protein